MRTVADQFAETLAIAGVKRIYGIVGDSLNGLTDAIRRQGKIEWLHVRHEEVGAFAAGAEAHLTGELRDRSRLRIVSASNVRIGNAHDQHPGFSFGNCARREQPRQECASQRNLAFLIHFTGGGWVRSLSLAAMLSSELFA